MKESPAQHRRAVEKLHEECDAPAAGADGELPVTARRSSGGARGRRHAPCLLALLLGSPAAAAAADADARFHELLRQELQRRASLEAGAEPSQGLAAAFAEAGDDGVTVARDLATDALSRDAAARSRA